MLCDIASAALPRSPKRPSPGIAMAVEKPLRRPGDGPPHLVDGLDVGPLRQVGVPKVSQRNKKSGS